MTFAVPADTDKYDKHVMREAIITQTYGTPLRLSLMRNRGACPASARDKSEREVAVVGKKVSDDVLSQSRNTVDVLKTYPFAADRILVKIKALTMLGKILTRRISIEMMYGEAAAYAPALPRS